MFLGVTLIDGHRQLVDVHDDVVRPLGRHGDVTDLVLDIASTGPQALRNLTRTQQQGKEWRTARAPPLLLFLPGRHVPRRGQATVGLEALCTRRELVGRHEILVR